MKGLRVNLTIQEKGCDENQLNDVAYFLQQELQELDCVTAITHAQKKPEFKAETAEAVEFNTTLIIVLNGKADPSTFVTGLAAWLDRHPFRTMKLEVGGFETGASSLNPRQRNALTAWFRRQIFDEEPTK